MNKFQQNEKVPFWSLIVTISLLVYFYALFACGEDIIAGKPRYYWLILASYFGFLVGAGIGVLQMVSRRQHLRKQSALAAEEQVS